MLHFHLCEVKEESLRAISWGAVEGRVQVGEQDVPHSCLTGGMEDCMESVKGTYKHIQHTGEVISLLICLHSFWWLHDSTQVLLTWDA